MINFYEFHQSPASLDHYDLYKTNIDIVRTGRLNTQSQCSDKAATFFVDAWRSIKHIVMRTPRLSIEYAKYIIKGRWYEAEPYILKSDMVYIYAVNVIDGRWPEGEEAMLKWHDNDGKYILYLYAKEIINGRWIEAEQAILTCSEATYYYAAYIIKERWEEAEYAMINNQMHDSSVQYYMLKYATNIMKERWLDAEPIIMLNDAHWESYKHKFKL